MTCPHCGTENEEGAGFCAACGARQDASALPKSAARSRAKTIFQGSNSSATPGPDLTPPARKLPPPNERDESLLSTLPGGSSQQPVVARPSAARPAPAPAGLVKPIIPTPGLAKPQTALPSAPRPAPAAAPPPSSMKLDADGELDLAGVIINGRYEVKERLGEGGFGAVFRAEQMGMGRICALKVLHARMAKDQQVVGRFRREAKAASVLKDGHTVQIFDFDQTPDGIFYMAMELVDGRSLHAEIQDGPIPANRVAHILDGVCSSLGEAHHHGIVHRDIKPENIFLENRPTDNDYAKVLDFGIAKIAQGSNLQGGPALTAAGQTLGTVEYMSPEQLMGLELDGRSDLYALGILAYEMLTSQLPFTTRTTAEMITAHLKTTPQPPSVHSPQLGIPPDMDAIVLKLLEKKRDKRYMSTADLQTDLRKVGTGQVAAAAGGALTPASGPAKAAAAAVSAAAPGPGAIAKQPAKGGMSTGTLIIIAGIAIGVLGLAAAAYWFFASQAHAAESMAIARLVPAEVSAVVAIDVPAVRSAGPPEMVDALTAAVQPLLDKVGADAKKLGGVALGADPPSDLTGAAPDEGGGGVLLADLPVDIKKLEANLDKPLTSAKYKELAIRRSGKDSYTILPNDRLALGGGKFTVEKIIDTSRGDSPSLIASGEPLLAKVGAPGGKGAMIVGYLKMNDKLRAGWKVQVPALGKLDDAAGALVVGAGGADAKSVARCSSPADAAALVAVTQSALKQASMNSMVQMLGLKSLIDGIKVSTDGPQALAALHLSKDQYIDLMQRMTGLVNAAMQAQQNEAPAAPLPPPTVDAPKKTKKGKKSKAQ